MTTSFPVLELPPEVLSSALGSFLDGKSMSTFLMVVQGCHSQDNNSVLSLLRNALVHRYRQLHQQLAKNVIQADHEQEDLRDVLQVLREDIRTTGDVSKFPEWCAILDYFESQMIFNFFKTNNESLEEMQQQHHQQQSGWVVWCGPIETIFGTFQASLRCTSEWTLGALHYWYNDIELQQFAIVHPHSRTVDGDDQFDLRRLYGRVSGLKEYDTLLLQRQHFNLEDDPQNWQHYLVLRSRSYDDEPPEFFTPVMGNDSSLFCYWDYREQSYDWEESLERLGESVIRIMRRSIQEKGSFP